MSLSGKILEGGFELKDLIEADETRALFRVRVLGDRELVATALFRRLDGAGADRQVELWETVRHLRDRHLNSPLGSGVTDLNGIRMPYVVLRQPDESLAGVLRERPLTQAETKDALLNVAKGLEVLHLNGLVHGNVCPEEVVAIGDSIRLSGEGVRTAGTPPPVDLKKATYLAPESKAANVTPESDVWSLGATVFETLTQKTWAEGERETADALPEPFATIALRCLVAEPSERCRLAEAVALAKGEIKPAPRPKPVPPAPVVPTPAAASVLPINEKEIHAAGLNGTSPAALQTEAKTEIQSPPTGDAKSPVIPASNASAAAAASSAPNTAIKKEPITVAKAVAEPKQQTRTPEPSKAPPAAPKQPIAKVQPINHGPAPSSFASKPYRPEPAIQRTDSFTEERSSKIWIWAGIAVLALLLLVWALRPKHTATVAGPSAPSSSAQTKAGGNAWETKTIQPDGTASSNAPATESKAAPAATATRQSASKAASRTREQNPPTPVAKENVTKPEATSANGNVWRTVIYTYNRQADADEKAKSLNAQHSDLHAEVYSPSGHGPYLVCAGGRMSKEDATDMRKRAVGMGLPRDSYIQNFKH